MPCYVNPVYAYSSRMPIEGSFANKRTETRNRNMTACWGCIKASAESKEPCLRDCRGTVYAIK